MKIDNVGDYYLEHPNGVNYWVILGRSYYPLVDEEMDDSEDVIFAGLSKSPQRHIFSLCIEGWI